MGHVREAHGKRSPLQQVFSCLMGVAHCDGDFIAVTDTSPGCVHDVGSSVLVVCGYHQHRLRV